MQAETIRDAAFYRNGINRVRYLMSDGGWWTYWELQQRIYAVWYRHYSESCISARIRDLRKPEFGGFVVERRLRVGTEATFEYRLHLEETEGRAA